jgi:proteasome lid subunit RPN8/RPN11
VGPERAGAWPLARLVALAEGAPDAEVCGLLVGGAGGEVEAWPVANVAATPATAFELDPGAVLDALRRLDQAEGKLLAVYHSHLAGGADLSARDVAGALAGGGPVLAGAAQVVVALHAGRVQSIRAHRWSGRGFEPADVWPPAGVDGPGTGA